ncbi:MAG: choice-of-anchor D domain-containing protein, partial [Bacteroidota bacterium]|nr:choice-of-anchor D domain-containing protein [Bacteroidota bacterium]
GVSTHQITVAAGDTMSFNLTFHPGAVNTGLRGTLTVTKNNTDCHKTLGLYGVGTGNVSAALVADPHEFSFGTLAVGQDTCKRIVITNTSNDGVMNFTGGLVCSNPDFTVTGWDPPSVILPGASVAITICYKPTKPGTQTTCSWQIKYSTPSNGDGSLSISFSGSSAADHNNNDSTVLTSDPHEFTFGTVPADSEVCRSVIVSNRTNQYAIITSWNTCENKDFSINPAFNGTDTLAPGSSMTFTICYTPHEANIQGTCTLTLHYIMNGTDGNTLSIGFGGNSSTNHGTSDSCMQTEQGDNSKDAVVIGGSAEQTLYLINKSDNDIIVNSAAIVGANASVFAITGPAFPITVPKNSNNTAMTYTFAPPSNNNGTYVFTAGVNFSLSGTNLHCSTVEGHLVGHVVHDGNTTDSTVRPLFPTEHRTLGIEGRGDRVTTTFYFTNNLQVDATVNSVKLANGTYFSIQSMTPSPAPFVLHPGDNLTVVIVYTATDNLVHHDTLLIDANHNLMATAFDLQGVQLAAGVPNALPSGVAINVSPNPASSYVNVDMTGVRTADVQVIDLLGNVVTTAKASASWKWNASNFVSGSYIVRIAGQASTGEQFVTSKRIVVSK